jgi:hypothetical protein
MAGKSELRVQEMMLSHLAAAVGVLGENVSFGPAKLSCPFVMEEHNGFFVSGDVACVVLLRCKGSWWGELATDEEKALFEKGSELAMYLRSSVSTPRDLGSVSQPPQPLIAGLLSAVIGK